MRAKSGPSSWNTVRFPAAIWPTDRGHRVADGVDDVHVDLDQGAGQAGLDERHRPAVRPGPAEHLPDAARQHLAPDRRARGLRRPGREGGPRDVGGPDEARHAHGEVVVRRRDPEVAEHGVGDAPRSSRSPARRWGAGRACAGTVARAGQSPLSTSESTRVRRPAFTWTKVATTAMTSVRTMTRLNSIP